LTDLRVDVAICGVQASQVSFKLIDILERKFFSVEGLHKLEDVKCPTPFMDVEPLQRT
jgi:hypothetical protein